MRWHFRHGDILDEKADVLVCSANPFLTLSGGVGGALLLRYGPSLQAELNDQLAKMGRKYVDRGSVVITHPRNTPYRAIIHAVAVNGFYETSSDVVAQVARDALNAAAAEGAHVVAMSALATGFGRLKLDQFARGIKEVIEADVPGVREVVIVVRSADEATELSEALATIS
jgi:O-acetyl-ADP-ribose deacetylase (regulator of RNase III)